MLYHSSKFPSFPSLPFYHCSSVADVQYRKTNKCVSNANMLDKQWYGVGSEVSFLLPYLKDDTVEEERRRRERGKWLMINGARRRITSVIGEAARNSLRNLVLGFELCSMTYVPP
jgi:hypothetical protein